MVKSKSATILAATALVVAVLGTTPLGHAAASMVLPRSSVGTVQLKKNAVTSLKVKNGTLMAADFKRGQLPHGPQGPAGPVGPAGQTGQPVLPIPAPTSSMASMRASSHRFLRAHKDAGIGGVDNFYGGQINSVSITVPVDGVLLISGNVFVRNGAATEEEPHHQFRVNGTIVTAPPFAGVVTLPPGFGGTLSSTLSHAVTAGAYTVTQSLANGSDMFYNAQELSVLFVPGTSASVSSLAAASSGASATGK